MPKKEQVMSLQEVYKNEELSHVNTIKFIEAFVQNRKLFIVTDFADGNFS